MEICIDKGGTFTDIVGYMRKNIQKKRHFKNIPFTQDDEPDQNCQ